ncbi:MAG: hypothetical protein IKZ50_05595 [Bacteroidales bacterium]|nr:hypothetical protein [Bacteroidales bacterium]
MKKIFVIVCVALLAVCSLPKGAAAQDKRPQHISFAGFPVDRTNVQFKINLMARGFRWVENLSAPGKDRFVGTFAGKNLTNIEAFYDLKTKAVYKIQVTMHGPSLEDAKKLELDLRDRLYDKYVNTNNAKFENETFQGRQFYRFTLKRDNSNPQYEQSSEILGYILLYKVKNEAFSDEDGETYDVILEYIDFINWDEHNRNLNSEQL